jgi:hypothetical protein
MPLIIPGSDVDQPDAMPAQADLAIDVGLEKIRQSHHMYSILHFTFPT